MKQENIYKQVESKVKEEKIIEKKYGIDKIPDGEPLFTTSQETDIWEMIKEGMNVQEILTVIKQW